MKLAQVTAPSEASAQGRPPLPSFCWLLLSAMLLPAAGQSPFIVVPPTNQFVCPGSDATFDIEAEGAPPMTFDWYDRNGVLVWSESNQNHSSFTIANAQPTNDGSWYSVWVSNLGGSVQSSPAFLFVNTNFCQPHTKILVQPQDQYACPESNATFYVEVNGPLGIDFLWFWYNTNVISGVVSSQSNSWLTLTNVQDFNDASPVHVLVTGPFPVLQSTKVFLRVPDPGICQQPSDTNVPLDGPISFQVVAWGTPPLSLSYQWWFKRFASIGVQPLTDNARVTGANTHSLEILNAGTPDAGDYWVIVTNGFGNSVTSRIARCSVGSPPTVSNLTSRIVRVYTTNIFSPTYGGPGPRTFQWYRNDVPVAGAISPSLTFPNVQRPQVGLYHVVAANPGGTVASPKVHLQVRLTLEGTTPIYREEATDEIYSLTNAVEVSFNAPDTAVFHGVPLLFTTYGATTSTNDPSRCGRLGSHSMWVLYKSPRTESLRVSTEGSDFDTVLAVYTNQITDVLTELKCDDNGGYDGKDSVLSFSATNARNYYLAVDGVSNATGTVRLQIGENIHKATYDRVNGTYRFEWAGTYWHENALITATSLWPPPINWSTITNVPPMTNDWILGYTNTRAWEDAARFYSTTVNTNATVP